MKPSSDVVKEEELEWSSHCSMYPFPPALTLVIRDRVRCERQGRLALSWLRRELT